jgi:cytochrome P450
MTPTVNLPPSPKSNSLNGHLSDFSQDPLGFLTKCAHEYGDVVYLRFGPFPAYLVSHPDQIEYVLANTNRQFTKNRGLRTSNRLLLGDGLLASEGNFWRRQRRLVQPAFHHQRIAAYGDAMVAYTRRMLATWQDGEIRELHQEMMQLTLAITAKTIFDVDVEGEDKELGTALSAAMEYFNIRNSNLLLLSESISAEDHLRFQQGIRQLDETIYSIIRQRRSSGEAPGDLLSMLLQAQDEDGNCMTDQEVRDELMTMVVGGYETTANTLVWVWMLLSQHPEVEAKLLEELQEVLGDRTATAADLPRLRYTESAVTESMRLYPPVWIMGREVVQDCEIGGYALPVGTTVFMSQWVTHRDIRFFDDPEAFNPDRWADGLAKRLPSCAYFPFGGRPRACIGKPLVMMEAVLVLATIVQNFQLRLVPGHPVTPWPPFTLRPKHGMKMLLTKR